MILASISGGQSLGSPSPTYRDRVKASAKGRCSVSGRKSKPYSKPSRWREDQPKLDSNAMTFAVQVP